MKHAISTQDMVDLLRGRGLEVADQSTLGDLLLNHNYYRLSGYFRQFQVDPGRGDDRFEAGTTVDAVVAAYEFNSRLTALLAPCLAAVECLVRSRFCYFAAHELGSGAFYLTDTAYLDVMPGRERFLEKTTAEVLRDKSRMTQRYLVGEDASALPIWVAVEVLSFGSVSKMITYLTDDTAAKKTADSFSFPWALFQSSVHSIAVLRNRCAHHSQLWHRRIDIAAPVNKKLARRERPFNPQGIFPTVMAVRAILQSVDRQHPDVEALDSFLEAEAALSEGIYLPKPR